MPTLDTLQTRYKEVMERVAAAATRAGRRASDVLVVAVTKYADMEQLRELVSLGHRDLAESKVQQLLQRAGVVEEMLERRRTMRGVTASHDAGLEGSRATEPSLFSPIAPRPRTQPGAGPAEPAPANGGVRWHMIGHLQRNKVKKAVEVSRLIHSVDSLRLVEEIQQFAFKRDRISEVLVQVNCSGEESKFGCAVPAAMHLCEQVDSMIHLRIRGLMTMAPLSSNPDDARRTFDRCRELFEEIRTEGFGNGAFNILSMGMTNDYETAIACGANLVRIGSAIFGEPTPEAIEADEADED